MAAPSPGSRLLASLAPLVLGACALALVPSALSPSLAPSHRDLLDFFLPMKAVAARELAAGNLPFWDPWTTGGQPFFANLQSQLLYPPNWLVVPAGPAWGLSLLTALHLAIAGLGARVLALRLDRTRLAALLAGVATTAGGFLVSLTDLHNQLCSAAWIPWAAAAAVSLGRGGPGIRAGAVAALSAALALSVLGGAPQVATLGGLFALALALLAAGADGLRREGLRLGTGLALAGVLAALAVGVQLVPFAAFVLESDRLGSDFAQGGRHALSPERISALVVAPDSPFDGPAGAYVRSLYLGGGVIALAALGVARGVAARGRIALGLTACVVGASLLAVGPAVPVLGPLIVDLTPWLRYPIKFWVVAAVAVPQLAAIGLDLARAAAARVVPRQAHPLAAALVALIAVELVAAGRPLWLALPADALLSPTPAIGLAAAQTGPEGPRLAAAPLTRERLRRRAATIARGDVLPAMRERVELLEGALPSIFEVHATWGANALTWRPRSRLSERLAHARSLAELSAALAEARAGHVLLEARSSPVPWPVVPVDGGAARLHALPQPPAVPTRIWLDTDRAVGAPGLPPPAPHPDWREGPPGTWSFEPRGFTILAVVSAAAWLAIAALAVAGSRRPRRGATSRRAPRAVASAVEAS